ncbi:MAG: cbb3-type cytochrome c oxidase subunit I [Chloroflexi bacterium]|nr:cbb3-type cytochrome c oxidase subunit I [Chloroflexota bacterium]
MKKSSSRGLGAVLTFFVVGFAVGLVIGILLHTLTTGKFEAGYLLDLPSWLLGILVAVVAFLYALVGYTGVVRGLLWQVAGTVGGALFVTLIRFLLGLKIYDLNTFGFTESAWVFGSLVGAISFLAGVGAISDWFQWALGKKTSDHHADQDGWQKYFGVSLDHKVIGIQYTFTSLFLLSVGGSFALVFRTELAKSGLEFLTLQLYNTLMSLHGMVMIVSLLLGVAGVINYLVPMMIGAQDMAFPRLNAFSFWVSIPAAVLLLSSLALGGFDTGWTGYPPLSVRAPLGMSMFFVGVWVAGWSSILGALNLIVTVLRMRARGMIAFRMPIFVWAATATSIISLTATQMIGLAFQLVLFQRLMGMPFFDTAKGGNPILFQHLFWFYSHPVVYVFVLPGLGVISELLPVFVRKPLFGYKWVAMSSLGIALVGFLVWAHHMFSSGMNEYLRVPFMYSTLLVAIPTGVKFFSWVATIWQGKLPRDIPAPMLFVLGGIVVFLLGGLTGPPNATVSTDLHLTDTYFIVGHFHDTMFGGYIYPFFAALYYWFPKATGKRLNEKLGKWHFWLMTPSFLILTLFMMRIGLLGMRRRIGDYDPALGFDAWHLAMTIAAFGIALAVLVFFYNIYITLKSGEAATGNIWKSRSPEWQVPSPMPAHNYDHEIEIVGEPYDYGLPGSVYVKISSEE